ncbi:DUF2497 domain-containing protein [Mesorhizobium sp. NBSH29]|uniref:PopZ family protein n=1 Tax=Mesorhizobium sp. NBSH29 TaxID=2654249 RepID=UPI00189643F8|nr:PopZ family protein [Mesorhizobium sp. NBSH29]QPC87548.1 DUF2497 domain-containing protein [Mesorhizobium sp. NBSH29]
MAQASNAQREPSMEEILASIRRIIEDSDTTQRKQEDMPPVAANASMEPPRPSTSAVDVDAFRAELRRAPDVHPQSVQDSIPEIDPGYKPSTLADVQAFISGGVHHEPQDEALIPSQSDEGATSHSFENEGDLSIEEELRSGLDFTHLDAPQRTDDEAVALDDDNGEEEWQPAASPKSEIISEQTSRQVAASFGELSEAFAATRKKSFDEMAESMLRPMLQDWFDNNLPLMVERLVREEIERVARGSR